MYELKNHSTMLSKHQSTSQTRLSWIDWPPSYAVRSGSEPKQHLTDHVVGLLQEATAPACHVPKQHLTDRVESQGSNGPPLRPG